MIKSILKNLAGPAYQYSKISGDDLFRKKNSTLNIQIHMIFRSISTK